jgi:hypothetical protein
MNYSHYKNISVKLLKNYGQCGRIVSYHNGTQKSLSLFDGIATPIDIKDLENTLIRDCNTSIFLVPRSNLVLDLSHYITWNNQLYKIMFIKEYKPTDSALIYQVFISQ